MTELTKKPLTLSSLREIVSQKPLIRVEISDLSEGETFICYRRDNMPAAVVEEFRHQDADKLKVILDVVSQFTLDEQGNPLGSREEWSQLDISILNSVLNALFESSNKVGEA